MNILYLIIIRPFKIAHIYTKNSRSTIQLEFTYTKSRLGACKDLWTFFLFIFIIKYYNKNANQSVKNV